MLHLKNWQGSQKGIYSLIFLLPLTVLLFSRCGQGKSYQEEKITMEAFSDMKTPIFVFDFPSIQRHLSSIANSESGITEADRCTKEIYQETKHLIWIDKSGVDHRADSLLVWLRQVNEIGMSPNAFGVASIEQDLQRIRTLDVDGEKDMSQLAARLEYALTKACLRYTYGERYGYVNPHRIFNRLLPDKQDTMGHVISYQGLFDIDMDLPQSDYYQTVLHKVEVDSIDSYLKAIQPKDPIYIQFKQMLDTVQGDVQRQRILCNMERSRWRYTYPIPTEGRRIIVNIPAFHLYAYAPDTTLDMKVVCGGQDTRTPQLTSEIEWMEVNPKWVIPMSIIKNDVVRHVGDNSYFDRNRYKIYDKATNKQVPVGQISRNMILSGNYRVAQDGGAGNSLGRIVFRFKNKYSVFLHDTSTPGAFSRASRALSHGCVRVSKPFDLAHFVLNTSDDWLLDRIRISMDMPPQTDQGKKYLSKHPNSEHKLIGYVPVKPHVPLYIIYYTIWPDQDGVMQTWPDVYNYDNVIWEHLKPYL